MTRLRSFSVALVVSCAAQSPSTPLPRDPSAGATPAVASVASPIGPLAPAGPPAPTPGALAAGSKHTCAIQPDKRLACWDRTIADSSGVLPGFRRERRA